MRTFPDELFARIRAKYGLLGLPEPDQNGGITEYGQLSATLDRTEKLIPDLLCSVVPSSFTADDPALRAYPRSANWRWTSAERALKKFSTQGLMVRLPLFWQVEEALFVAARAAGMPIFLNDRGNMPAGAIAIATANMDTIITDTEDAQAFSSYLSQKNAAWPVAWMIVHPITTMWEPPLSLSGNNIQVAQEVHLFPGLPILEQCAALIEKKAPIFHLVNGYALETTPEGSLISGSTDDPLPLYRYLLPAKLRETGVCTCGKTRYIRA